MSIPVGYLTPQRRETLMTVYSAWGQSWVTTRQVRELHSDLGRLAVESRLKGLMVGGFVERQERHGPHGRFVEWRVTEKGRQHAR